VAVRVLATCGSVVLSGYRYLAGSGWVNLLAVAILARLTIDGFASLWCAWAAVAAGVIAIHLRSGDPGRTVAALLA